MTDTQVDVAIIGGGMVGASLAIGLAGTGVATLLVEGTPPGSQSQPSFDDRTTALGNSSRRIFQGLGVWDRLAAEAAAIRTIHVSDAGRFGFARLVASEQGIDAFGYVIPNRVIGAALWEKLRDAQGVLLRVPARPEQVEIGTDAVSFRIGDESVSARLVVAADGAHSVVRSAAGIEADVEDYDQIAVVANVAADRPHDGTAYERFTESGPLAVLPLRDGSYGVVWTCAPARAAEVIVSAFGDGRSDVGLAPGVAPGIAPGTRPSAGAADVGSPELLRQFAAWRETDRRGVVGFTDGLVKMFASTRPGVGILRNLGLLLFDLTPPAKSALSRVSAGFGGPTPRLARGLRLT
jgi:2-octaprenyl-6-methoxyphenol hydroxylase